MPPPAGRHPPRCPRTNRNKAAAGSVALTVIAALTLLAGEVILRGRGGAQLGRVATFFLLLGVDACAAVTLVRLRDRRTTRAASSGNPDGARKREG